MARNYKEEYARRIARATEKGFTRAQARGHARAEKGEKPISVVAPRTPKPKPPTITKRIEKVSTPDKPKKIDRVVRTYSTSVVEKQMKSGKGDRVYFRVWNPEKGQFSELYRGKRGKPHGIGVKELLERIATRQRNAKVSGEDLSFDEAFREQIEQDSGGYGGDDSPGDEDIPYDFSQVEMYVMNTGNFD